MKISVLLLLLNFFFSNIFAQVKDPFQGMKDGKISTIDFLVNFLNNKEVIKHFKLDKDVDDTLYVIDCNSLVAPINFKLSTTKNVQVINNTRLDLNRRTYSDEELWKNHIQLKNLYFCDRICYITVVTKYRNLGGSAKIKENNGEFKWLDYTLGVF